jgi:UDP-glucose 4-epimerase
MIEQCSPNAADSKFILVTGGLGYIGSHTTLEILRRGHNVIIIDDLSNSFPVVFDRIQTLVTRHYKLQSKPMPLFRFYNVDYRDHVALKTILDTYTPRTENGTHEVSQITGVIHFAASKSVPDSITQPLQYYANNVSGLVDLCAILGEYSIKNLVFSSSAAVYGATASQIPFLPEELCVHQPEEYTDEHGHTQRVEPGSVGLTSPYSRTKWMCEAVLADLCASDPSWNVIALRYFNPISCDSSGILGERARGVPTNLMPVVTSVMTGELPVLNVYGSDYDTIDGTAVRDFIHVSDLALGHIAALDAMADGRICGQYRTFNLGSSTGHSVLEVVKAMELASNRTIPYQKVDRRAGDLPSCVAKNTRAAVELGWIPERSLDQCASDLCNYLVLNGMMDGPSSTI